MDVDTVEGSPNALRSQALRTTSRAAVLVAAVLSARTGPVATLPDTIVLATAVPAAVLLTTAVPAAVLAAAVLPSRAVPVLELRANLSATVDPSHSDRLLRTERQPKPSTWPESWLPPVAETVAKGRRHLRRHPFQATHPRQRTGV